MVKDLNKDGVISVNEVDSEIKEEKANTQKAITWTVVVAMLVVTALLLSPLIGDERIKSLAALFDLYYIASASIVGAYFGMTAYMTRK